MSIITDKFVHVADLNLLGLSSSIVVVDDPSASMFVHNQPLIEKHQYTITLLFVDTKSKNAVIVVTVMRLS